MRDSGNLEAHEKASDTLAEDSETQLIYVKHGVNDLLRSVLYSTAMSTAPHGNEKVSETMGKHRKVLKGKSQSSGSKGPVSFSWKCSPSGSILRGFFLSKLISEATAMYSRGTVKGVSGFDAKADAEALRKAMKGLGTDEETILKILTSRSNAQRQEIALAFKTLFGRDLVADLKSELTGKFETLMFNKNNFTSHFCLLQGAGTNEKVLNEILASRTPAEVQKIKQVYQEEYEADLEDHIKSDTSGYYQRMLIVLLQ
ncbi:hypothetical protein JRQ81_016760, partial [Phrynocephalus forsythii]